MRGVGRRIDTVGVWGSNPPRLPFRFPVGATSVSVSPSTTFLCKFGQATDLAKLMAPNQRVLVSFTPPVPQSGEGEMVNGELHVDYPYEQSYCIFSLLT
jgi:hypothetical protein